MERQRTSAQWNANRLLTRSSPSVYPFCLVVLWFYDIRYKMKPSRVFWVFVNNSFSFWLLNPRRHIYGSSVSEKLSSTPEARYPTSSFPPGRRHQVTSPTSKVPVPNVKASNAHAGGAVANHYTTGSFNDPSEHRTDYSRNTATRLTARHDPLKQDYIPGTSPMVPPSFTSVNRSHQQPQQSIPVGRQHSQHHSRHPRKIYTTSPSPVPNGYGYQQRFDQQPSTPFFSNSRQYSYHESPTSGNTFPGFHAGQHYTPAARVVPMNRSWLASCLSTPQWNVGVAYI